MKWRLWRRGRRLDLMPAGGTGGREREAREMLALAERKGRDTARLADRIELLAAETRRALGVGP